ncbi:hypothetical protein LNAOJCKE_0437 [Methylorubrum aminovorans]|uniref:Uncharacterized protein n=1 Tax=Methylorubrum aminovorans TaxID=269069 RepID=A0ABQ4U893_9HYPH|nr:hypothetical protein [Methylorubrum aminovorans]GJE63243.1 hypothetical protein LNAOJCKE_0437 [Methylorubrum aminovorans]GMA79293.1 hypothetical protein GCM10025880_57100 [Methylorubrum aminovorans]
MNPPKYVERWSNIEARKRENERQRTDWRYRRPYDPANATDEEHHHEWWRRTRPAVSNFQMKRGKRDYDRGLGKLEHWQGIYRLPRIVRRALKRPLAPLLMSGRRKVIAAVDALLTLIGRYHTSPRNFVGRGCGIGEDGGFLLDRRGLSGPYAPPGCSGLTEWSAREATQFLLEVGIIDRVTPKALMATQDRTGRSGFWMKATKDKATGRIKAEPIRYRLGRLYRSLFSKALGWSQPPEVPSGKSPVGENITSQDNRDIDVGAVGVSTGGELLAATRSPEEWLAMFKQIQLERYETDAAERKAAAMADLEMRKARRLARGW